MICFPLYWMLGYFRRSFLYLHFCVFHLFIHSFNKYLLSTSFISGLVHKAAKINRTDTGLGPSELYKHLRGTDN